MISGIDNEEYLWVQKYRPKTINDCILSTELKQNFQQIIDSQRIPNLIFSGPAGCGKTTCALALCEEVGADVLFINASLQNGIDTLRSTITQFASTISLTDAKKVVILDEADYTNPQSFQPALRGAIEEFSKNVTFILTCNFKNRIIEPLHSRCAVVDFKIPVSEKKVIAGDFFKRVVSILKTEGVSFDKKIVAEMVQKHFPDFRRVINELQRYSVSGSIDSGILVNLSTESYKELFKIMREKNFSDMRKWVATNGDSDTSLIFRTLYEASSSFLEPSSVPQLIILLADYQYKAAFVADHEINLMACLTEIAASCKFV
jgi:DNA polymerase III delta prime subunit